MEADFLQIYTKGMKEHPLEITGSHFVYVVADNGEHALIPAAEISVGDILVQSNVDSEQVHAAVTKIALVKNTGLYMPLTPSGTIVVNGISASAYVSLDSPKVATDAKWLFGLSDPGLQHLWLAPHRMLCMGVSSKFCGTKEDSNNFNTNDEGILNTLFHAKQLLEFAEEHGFFLRMVIGIPIFVVFAVLNGIEFCFGGPALAPSATMMMALAAAAAYSKRRALLPANVEKKEV
jgi:hypothetical protein